MEGYVLFFANMHGKVSFTDLSCKYSAERDFIDCDARSSGLTISGFYYLCLNRKTGALSGFYFDPLSTPHQKLELEVARTRCPMDRTSPSQRQSQEGGIWFGSYSVI